MLADTPARPRPDPTGGTPVLPQHFPVTPGGAGERVRGRPAPWAGPSPPARPAAATGGAARAAAGDVVGEGGFRRRQDAAAGRLGGAAEEPQVLPRRPIFRRIGLDKAGDLAGDRLLTLGLEDADDVGATLAGVESALIV